MIDTEHPQNELGKLGLTIWAIEAVEKKKDIKMGDLEM